MSSKLTRVVVGAFVVAVALGFTHAWLNLGFDPLRAVGLKKQVVEEEKFKVGFLPVTCHLTCPVSDWIRKNMQGRGLFEPVRFSGWPELKEAHISGQTPATFILAPMAMALRQQGIKSKIVFLGHRDGSALMVRKDSDIHDFKDLRGKRVAVPNRFSNQFLIIYKALKDRGMSIDDLQIVEMPPPDMPAALYAKAVDAIISGEPFMAQTELDGYGRVLYQAQELWPNFISCVLAVNDDFMKKNPQKVQDLVTGIAKSGLWLESGMNHRMEAATVVATQYYNQNPRLLRFVLSKPPDRVTYGNLRLARGEFDHIMNLALEAGILKQPIAFEEYADTRFSENTTGAGPYPWKG